MVDVMFINNKYKFWYDSIIQKAKVRNLSGYKEKHHILPRCLGGKDNQENLVELTAREHFIVHMLLCKFTKGQAKRSMLYAFKCMCYYKKDGRNYKINSRIAQKLRSELKFSKNHKINLSLVKKGKPSNRKGKKASDKTKLRIKKALSGKKHSQKHKDTLSKIRKQLIWVNNNIKSKRIKKDELQNYLNIGYKLGRDKSYLTKEYSLNMSKLTQAYWDRRSV
jgi:hypothetical protein